MVARVKAKLQDLQAAEEQKEPGTNSESNTETETEHEPETKTKEFVWIAKSSGNTHPIEQEHAVSSLISVNSDICWKPSQSIVEDKKEGSDDNQALDVKNGTKNVEEQANPKDSQDTILRMLKGLCHRNDLSSCSHLQPADSAMEILQDCVALQKAQEELERIAKEKKLADFVHCWILAMGAVLNVFLDKDLQFTWKTALVIVAKSQGHGTTCVLRSGSRLVQTSYLLVMTTVQRCVAHH